MKLLLTHRYFWPDTAPYALMLRTIGEGLAENGHDVHVFASRPSYRKGGETAAKSEELGSLKVRRCWVFQENRNSPVLRAMNVLLYCFALFFEIIRLRPDVVTASTFPPVVAAWTASLAARLVGARFIYHVQDIHPEVSQYSGGRLGRGIQFKILRWLDNQTLKRSAAIVVLSDDMAGTVRGRGLDDLPILVLNNFQLGSFGQEIVPPRSLVKDPDKRRLIFAGNMGRFQNTALLVEGVMKAIEGRQAVELLLLGDGDALPELRRSWGNHPQVLFSPFLPFEQASSLIRDADIGLVSLSPHIYKVSHPSKVLTYAGLHLPMLVLVEPESHLAREIQDKNLGTVPNEHTVQGIADAVSNLLDGPALGPSVAAWDKSENSIDTRLEAWSKIVEAAVA